MKDEKEGVIENQKMINEKKQTRDSGNVIWGLMLVMVGLTLLLINMGLVSPFVWAVLWQYWPVLLILAGVRILVDKSKAGEGLMTLVGIVVLGLVWIKALATVNSPVIYMWGLDRMSWYQWLRK